MAASSDGLQPTSVLATSSDGLEPSSFLFLGAMSFVPSLMHVLIPSMKKILSQNSLT